MTRIASILIALWLSWPGTVVAYTANNGAKQAISDGSRQDFIDMMAYVKARGEDWWYCTNGAAGGSYSWGTGSVTIDNTNHVVILGASSSSRPTITFTHSGAEGLRIRPTKQDKYIILRDHILRSTGTNTRLILVDGGNADQNPDTATPNFWIDRCRFDERTERAIWVLDNYGAITRSWFERAAGISSINVQLRDHNAGWIGNTTPATEQMVCLESNVFNNVIDDTGQQGLDGDQMCKVLIRFNVYTNFDITTHGDDSSGASNSCLLAEIYGNIFAYTSVMAASGVDRAIQIRGGTGLVFSNTVVTSGGAGLNFMVKFAFGAGSSTCCGFSCTQRVFSYPGDQQVGRGVSNNVAGVLMPVFTWNNNWVTGNQGTFGICEAAFIQANRDYYANTARPGYAPLGTHSVWSLEGGSPPPDPDLPAVNGLRVIPITIKR